MADASQIGITIDEVEFPVEAGKVREFAIAVGGPESDPGRVPVGRVPLGPESDLGGVPVGPESDPGDVPLGSVPLGRVPLGHVSPGRVSLGHVSPGRVPLTFAAVASHWRDQAAMVRVLGLDIRRVVVGGSEWEHHAPVQVGDRLAGARVVTAITVKESGMTLITLECKLFRGDGELVVTQRDTVIELPVR